MKKLRLVKLPIQSRAKCVCCGETSYLNGNNIGTSYGYRWQVEKLNDSFKWVALRDDKNQSYCLGCKEYAIMNNPGIYISNNIDDEPEGVIEAREEYKADKAANKDVNVTNELFTELFG